MLGAGSSLPLPDYQHRVTIVRPLRHPEYTRGFLGWLTALTKGTARVAGNLAVLI